MADGIVNRAKKQRSIEGVGPSSVLELKAQLYESQEEPKKSKELNGSDVEFHRAKKKIASRDSFSAKNSGVDARALKEVHEEASQAREKASELKLCRQEQAEVRREKLRQAYLRKLLEKQKLASSTEQT